MNIAVESASPNLLYCELCDFIPFASYTDFHTHHLLHVRQPLVRLVKLNANLCAKLEAKSYRVNTGVARRTFNLEHVPPLKISLIKQEGTTHFHVIKKEKKSSGSSSPDLTDRLSDFDSKTVWNESRSKGILCGYSGVSEVEGKNLLERFGANISVCRKGKPGAQALNIIKEEEDGDGNGNGNCKKDSDASPSNVDVKKDYLLERLSGIGGISISTKPKLPTNGNPESKTSGISISSKLKAIDINQLKKIKDQDSENDRIVFDRNKILEKLSGSGSISIAPKSQGKSQSGREDEEESITEEQSKESFEGGSPKSTSQDVLERLGSGITVTGIRRSRSVDSNDGSELKNIEDSQKFQVNVSEEENGKVPNENSSESCEQKKFVRVKNSTFSKKNIRPEKQNSLEEPSEERLSVPEELKEKESELKESGIDILERLTDNLNNAVGVEKAAEVENSEDSNPKTMEEPLLTTPSASEDPEFTASQTECTSPNIASETHFNVTGEGNSQEQEQECSLLLTPPSSSGQDGENSNYSTISSHQPEYVDSGNVSEENNDVSENSVSFTSLTNEEEQSQVPNEQPIEQTSFWTDIRNASNSVDQPQQDPLMTPENPVPNGESMNQNFLHNFLTEHQPPTNNIPPENSEFMSLDRLAQTQHQQPPYDLNSAETNTPMEQLSQQVQRIPNPTPQINVISQHHMQAPQPPQLHTGVPLSPQHISPNTYDTLGHMQPPMPPPLYQGFNMYNQNYPQTPPQMPRPPMLQQRPQIQPRPFQSLANPSRPRPRAVKRNLVRLPAPHEMGPPKQRRIDPPLQARPQVQNPTAKIPSGITVTPPKRAVEANKVANVLASRGITVTPAASRQVTQPARPQQRNNTPTQSPILNISSAISITSSSQNRGNGGFAVPGPRRNAAPIVNHNIERPERCTTVDLTLDDEPPQLHRNRGALGRYPCNQCGKIFTSSVTLESHKASHRAAGALPFKCDKCSAQYTTSAHLQQHKLTFHKSKQSAPDLAIPIVDLNHPGAREQLLKCGVYNFLPLAQLQSNNNGYFGVPIIQLDTAKEKAVSNLSTLGAGNIFILGKMKALAPQSNH